MIRLHMLQAVCRLQGRWESANCFAAAHAKFCTGWHQAAVIKAPCMPEHWLASTKALCVPQVGGRCHGGRRLGGFEPKAARARACAGRIRRPGRAARAAGALPCRQAAALPRREGALRLCCCRCASAARRRVLMLVGLDLNECFFRDTAVSVWHDVWCVCFEPCCACTGRPMCAQ